MTSVSERTATLASGRMKPLVIGAATTTAPGVPGADVDDRGVHALGGQRGRRAGSAPGRWRRTASPRSPRRPARVTPAARRAGSPATGSKRRTVSAAVEGPSGTGGSGDDAGWARAQQAVERHVEPGERLLLRPPWPPRWRPASRPAPPPRRAAARPVADPPRLDQDHLGPRRQEVGQDPLAAVEEREPRLHAVELLARSRCSHTDAPQGRARPERRRRLAQLRGEHELPAAVEGDGGEVVRRPLVADRERGQAVDLVAPQVDAHRLVGRRGEDVDDPAPHGELARGAPPGARAGSPAPPARAATRPRRPARPADHERCRPLQRAEPLQQGPDRRDDRRGAAAAAPPPPAAAARRARPGAGPSSRSRGSPARRAGSPRPAGRRRRRRARPTTSPAPASSLRSRPAGRTGRRPGARRPARWR